MTPLLTRFVASVNDFLMSLWSQSLVSSLLQHGTMFILLATVSFRVKNAMLSEGKLLCDSFSVTSNQVILLSSTLSSNHGHFWLRKKQRDDVSKLLTWGLIAVYTFINRLSSIKCSIKDFLFTDLGSFVSSDWTASVKNLQTSVQLLDIVQFQLLYSPRHRLSHFLSVPGP